MRKSFIDLNSHQKPTAVVKIRFEIWKNPYEPLLFTHNIDLSTCSPYHWHFNAEADFSSLLWCCWFCFFLCACCLFKQSLTFSWHLVSMRFYQASVWAATAMNWQEPRCSFTLDCSILPSHHSAFRKMPPVQLKNLPPHIYAASGFLLHHPLMVMSREV